MRVWPHHVAANLLRARTDAKTATLALIERKGHTNQPKEHVCLWFDKDAHKTVRFYAATFPDSKVTAYS